MEIFIIKFALIYTMKSGGKEDLKERLLQSGFFKDKFDIALGALGARYGIDCFYMGDSILQDIGICSLYLPLDIRDEFEKYEECLDRLVFKIDGSIIENAQFNSVLLIKEQVCAVKKTSGLEFDIESNAIAKKDLKNGAIVHEVIAVNEPDLSNLENRIIY